MQNRFVPEWVSSFAKHNEKWVKVQAGQHHTMLLDEAGMSIIIINLMMYRTILHFICNYWREGCIDIIPLAMSSFFWIVALTYSCVK